jgi:hypothetical protein
MYEELDNVVRIFNSLEKKVERITERQNDLGKKLDGSINKSQNLLDGVSVKKHKKKKTHK